MQVQEELLLAKQSRLEGNEGRARVCARRAAGAAVQVYLDRKELNARGENAIESLLTLKELVLLPDRVQQAVKSLVQRVNLDHNLPLDVDLIHEASIVIQYLEDE